MTAASRRVLDGGAGQAAPRLQPAAHAPPTLAIAAARALAAAPIHASTIRKAFHRSARGLPRQGPCSQRRATSVALHRSRSAFVLKTVLSIRAGQAGQRSAGLTRGAPVRPDAVETNGLERDAGTSARHAARRTPVPTQRARRLLFVG